MEQTLTADTYNAKRDELIGAELEKLREAAHYLNEYVKTLTYLVNGNCCPCIVTIGNDSEYPKMSVRNVGPF